MGQVKSQKKRQKSKVSRAKAAHTNQGRCAGLGTALLTFAF